MGGGGWIVWSERMIAIFLVAGYGTRMYPLTETTAKPLLTVAGRPVMDYLYDNIVATGRVSQICLVSNAKYFSQFADWAAIKRGEIHAPGIQVINDGTRTNETRLGAIADLALALRTLNIDDDVFVSSGDNLYPFDFANMIRFFDQKSANTICIWPIRHSERLRRTGVVQVDADFRVIDFEEKPAQPRSNYGTPSIYIFKKSTIAQVYEYLASGHNPDAPGHFISWLFQRSPVFAFLIQQEIYDIGNLQTYYEIDRLWQAQRRA